MQHSSSYVTAGTRGVCILVSSRPHPWHGLPMHEHAAMHSHVPLTFTDSPFARRRVPCSAAVSVAAIMSPTVVAALGAAPASIRDAAVALPATLSSDILWRG
eukprot:366525-Chlamydomonas_euryale.AAC.1